MNKQGYMIRKLIQLIITMILSLSFVGCYALPPGLPNLKPVENPMGIR